MGHRKIEDLLDDRAVPEGDKLLLGVVSAGFPLRGQDREFDGLALSSIDYLSRKYPEIFREAQKEMDAMAGAGKQAAGGAVH